MAWTAATVAGRGMAVAAAAGGGVSTGGLSGTAFRLRAFSSSMSRAMSSASPEPGDGLSPEANANLNLWPACEGAGDRPCDYGEKLGKDAAR
jgi:hypothetical protein